MKCRSCSVSSGCCPEHWWEGTDAAGKKRDIGATILEPPLGNAAYRIKEFVAGRSVVYERVKDYWAKDLNVNIGRDNFDEIRYEYFRDPMVALEAFKADHVGLAHREQRQELGHGLRFLRGQGQAGHARGIPPARPRDDAGLRLQHCGATSSGIPGYDSAFNFAFDFEEMNKQFFFGQYRRINSYFEGTELACSGPAAGGGAQNPGAAARQGAARGVHHPVCQSGRRHAREGAGESAARACGSCAEAGYEVRDHKQVNVRTGEVLSVEILNLTSDPLGSERFILFYKPSLARLGIDISVRNVDNIQYENRLRNFDFDIIDSHMAAVAVARQRATRPVEHSGGRYAGLAQLRRHQESGG